MAIARFIQGLAGGTGAGDDLEHLVGPAALASHGLHEQSGQRCVLGGLEHDGVACRERGDGIAEGVDQRVVPRPDDSDHAEGFAAGVHAASQDERRQGPHPRVGEVAPRGAPNGLILHRGLIVAEWGDTARVDMTFSVAKSYLSLLADALRTPDPAVLPPR